MSVRRVSSFQCSNRIDAAGVVPVVHKHTSSRRMRGREGVHGRACGTGDGGLRPSCFGARWGSHGSCWGGIDCVSLRCWGSARGECQPLFAPASFLADLDAGSPLDDREPFSHVVRWRGGVCVHPRVPGNGNQQTAARSAQELRNSLCTEAKIALEQWPDPRCRRQAA